LLEQFGDAFVALAGLGDDEQAVHVLDGGGAALVGPGGHVRVGLVVDGPLDDVDEFLGTDGLLRGGRGGAAEEVAEAAAARRCRGGLRDVADLEPRGLAAEVRDLGHEVLHRVRDHRQVLLELLLGGDQDVARLDLVAEVGAKDQAEDRLDAHALDLEVDDTGGEVDAGGADVGVNDDVEALLDLADVLEHVVEAGLLEVEVDLFAQAPAGLRDGLRLGRDGLREIAPELREVFPRLGVGVPQQRDDPADIVAGVRGGLFDIDERLDGAGLAGLAYPDLAGLRLEVQQVFAPPQGAFVFRVDGHEPVEDLDGLSELHAAAQFGGAFPQLADLAVAVDAVGLAALFLALDGFALRIGGPLRLGVGLALLDLLAEDEDLLAEPLLLLGRQDGGHVDRAVGLRQRAETLHVVLGPFGPPHVALSLGHEFLDAGDDALPVEGPDVADDVAQRLLALGQQFHGLVEARLGLGVVGPQAVGPREVDLGLLVLMGGQGLVAEFHLFLGLGAPGLGRQIDGGLLRRLLGRFLRRLLGRLGHRFLGRLGGRLLDGLGGRLRGRGHQRRLDGGHLLVEARQFATRPPAEVDVHALDLVDGLAGVGDLAIGQGRIGLGQQVLGVGHGLRVLVRGHLEGRLGRRSLVGRQVRARRRRRQGCRGRSVLLLGQGILAVHERLFGGRAPGNGLGGVLDQAVISPLFE